MHKWSRKQQKDFLETGTGRHLHAVRLKYISDKITKMRKEVRTPLRILDLGCGDGLITEQLERIVGAEDEIFGVDNDSIRIQRARGRCRRTRFLLLDAQHLVFNDDFFDIIIAHHILEHVYDDKKVLCEVRRVLNKNGILILGVPHEGGRIGIFLRLIHRRLYQKSEHINFYAINTIRALVTESGFRELEFSKFGFLFPFYYIHLLLLGNWFTFAIGNRISQKIDFTADSLIFVLKK